MKDSLWVKVKEAPKNGHVVRVFGFKAPRLLPEKVIQAIRYLRVAHP